MEISDDGSGMAWMEGEDVGISCEGGVWYGQLCGCVGGGPDSLRKTGNQELIWTAKACPAVCHIRFNHLIVFFVTKRITLLMAID